MSNDNELEVHDYLEYTMMGTVFHHEIHNGTQRFAHRLRIVDGVVLKKSLWVPWQSIARLDFRCPDCAHQHYAYAIQDYYAPQFPPFFILHIPQEIFQPGPMKPLFKAFQDWELP